MIPMGAGQWCGSAHLDPEYVLSCYGSRWIQYYAQKKTFKDSYIYKIPVPNKDFKNILRP